MSGFDREREIEDLLKGRGGSGDAGASGGEAESGGGREPGSDDDRGLEDLLGDPHGGGGGESPAADSGEALRPFNYGALVGLALVLVAVLLLVNFLRTEESGTVGIGDVGIGEKVAPFAAPIATSGLEGDANIDPARACQVEGADVLRICDYFDRPLVISFWFTSGASECIDQQDVFESVADRFRGRVAMVSVNVRDDRDRVRDLIAEHDWKVPVAHDTDGAVSNIYRVGGCPTFLFVAPGGVLQRAEVGGTSVAELSSQVRSFADGQE